MNLTEKQQILKNNGCCFRCFQKGHRFQYCKASLSCVKCKKRHHAVMCPEMSQNRNPTASSEDEKKTEPKSLQLASMSSATVLLQTLAVNLKCNGKERSVRAIIDTGSQRSYILDSTAKRMGFFVIGSETLKHALFGGSNSEPVGHPVYKVQMRSIFGNYACTADMLGQKTICQTVPPVPSEKLAKELSALGIQLADIRDGPIEILFGADVVGKLMTGGYKRFPCGLAAIQTELGWTVMGKTPQADVQLPSVVNVTCLLSQNADVNRLWDLDVLGIADPVEMKDKRELQEAAEAHFEKTVKRDEEGRYEVSLPWIEGHQRLPTNKSIAEKRLKNTTKSLQEKNIVNEYGDIFKEWEFDKVIESVDESCLLDSNSHYLPHRPVLKENSTTKIRPVFDASAKGKNSVSLNDCLEKGPNLVELIPKILTRFRIGKFGIIADIKKAFLQISVAETDRDYLKFLWWDSEERIQKIFRHCRVVFGLSCSPFLLGAVLQYHLDQYLLSESHAVVERLKSAFYVDNCVTSVASEAEVYEFLEVSTKIMKEAKFDLRGWTYNEMDVADERRVVPLLGLKWDILADSLFCDVGDNALEVPVTKRKILSAANTVFDPLGFLSPVTLIPKLLLQECWRGKFTWDAELPDELVKRFLKWKKSLINLKEIKVPRHLKGGTEPQKWSLHVFCDSSGVAYATCIFLGVQTASNVSVTFVQARTRVAPLKPMTIPRLELMSCLIRARLASAVM